MKNKKYIIFSVVALIAIAAVIGVISQSSIAIQ